LGQGGNLEGQIIECSETGNQIDWKKRFPLKQMVVLFRLIGDHPGRSAIIFK